MSAQISDIFVKIFVAAFLLTGFFSMPARAQNDAARTHPRFLDEPANAAPLLSAAELSKAGTRPAADAIADPTVDAAFSPYIVNSPGSIRATAFASENFLLVAGFFNRPGGADRYGVFRYYPQSGAITNFFSPKISDVVHSIVVQPDGKVLIGGGFTRVDGVTRNRIARLNADGTLDPTFDPPGGMDNAVYTLSLQPDGKVIAGGFFTNVNGDTRANLVRLNADGTTDHSFNLPLENTGFVFNTQVQPDGKILVGGFYALAGASANSTLLRVNPNGSPDPTFNPTGSGANSTVREIKRQPDGKLLVGGNFTTYNGTTRNRLARLNADGTLDASFAPGAAANGAVYSIAELNDGKLMIGGFFTTYDAVSRNSIARLNPDGTLDTTFNPGAGFNGGVYEVTAIPSLPNVFAGGNFTTYNNAPNQLGAMLRPDGIAVYSLPSSTAQPNVRATVIQPDGKIVVGGSFNLANNAVHNSLVRLNADGTPDATFSAGANAQIYAMARQADGKILIGGSFTSYDNAARNRLARVNADGSLDTSFVADLNSSVANITLLPNGKMLVGGGFTIVNGAARAGLALLNADGTLDNSFVFNGQFPYIEGVVVQPDGKIVIGGVFTHVDSIPRHSLARLNPNGSLDVSFFPPTLPNTGIYSLALQTDGKILAGGTFFVEAEVIQRGIARFNADGSRDHDFLVGSGTGVNEDVEDIVVQPNGKILIGGAFGSINGTPRGNLARLNANGTLDLAFKPNVDNIVWDINVEADGARRIIIGGDFTRVDNQPPYGVARLIPDLPFNRTPFDFDGDAKTDFSIFRPSNGEWWINRSSTFQTVAAQFGAASDKSVPADYTGDGKTDIAFFRPSSGEWFILRSEDASFLSFPFGASNDVPIVGDFDGDGKADPTVYRPSTSEWYILKSSGGTAIVPWGIAGDVPAAADYDGNGKTDIAVFRPSNGQWWILPTDGTVVRAFEFGGSADKPVVGDYTGDGRADAALFRPASGEWLIMRSEDSSFYSLPFGTNGDLPAPGDYDGDGKFDTAVFRPSGSKWFINGSTSGISIVTFGTSGDRPIPNSFVR